MAVLVALASEDEETIHQHFGRTTQFLIYEIDGTSFRFVEARDNRPPCNSGSAGAGAPHDEDRMGQTIDLVADCRAVLVARIGPRAVQRLAERGIGAFEAPNFIDPALRRLIASGALHETVTQAVRRV